MLGSYIHDPQNRESEVGSIAGMGLLDIEFDFGPEKTLARRRYSPTPENFLARAGEIEGYEIHAGWIGRQDTAAAFTYEGGVDGAVHARFPTLGTLIHDFFANPAMTRAFTNRLRASKGLPPLTAPLPTGRQRADESYSRLASMLASDFGF